MSFTKYCLSAILAVSLTTGWSQKPESDARYLSITREYQLMPDGSQKFHYSHSLKYLTHRAFHNLYGETFVIYNPDFQKLTINKSVTTMRDGKTTPTPLNGYNEVLPRSAANAARVNHLREMVITHTGLEVGCKVDLDYTIETAAGIFPGLFGELTLAEVMPADEFTVVIKVPSGTTLHHTLTSLRLEPGVTREGNYDVYTWKVGATQPIPDEDFLPEASEWLPNLSFSTLPSFYSAYEWFVNQPLFTETRLPVEARNKVSLMKQAEPDPLKLALKLRDMVVSQMGNIPLNAKYIHYKFNTIGQVWNANAAMEVEKAVLLAAMLREAGMNAAPRAVVPTRPITQDLGNPGVFNHFVVNIIPAEGQEYSLPLGHYNNDARYLFAGQTLLQLEPAAESLHKTETGFHSGSMKMKGLLTLSPEGKATGDLTVSLLWLSNPWFKLLDDNQAIKGHLTSIPPKAITELKTTKLNKEQTEAYLKITDAELMTELAPGILSLTLPGFSQGVTTWGLQTLPTTRSAPFSFPEIHDESVILTLVLPEGYSMLTPLVNLTQKTNWGNLMLEIRQRGNQVIIHRGFETTMKTISTHDYQELREMMNRWNNSMYQRLIFKKR